MRLPASGSCWSEQILDTVPNERFCARDLKESKSDRTHPAAFLCVKRSLQSKVIGQICVFFDANGKSCTKGKHAKHFPLWRERGTIRFSEWWKVECCMLGYRNACCCTFDSYSALKLTIRPQEWLCHSRLRMAQSLQIAEVKRNVLFLKKASMQKLINGSMQNVFLSGERGGPSKMVESRCHFV